MFGKQDLSAKSSQSGEEAGNIQSNGPMSEQRKEEKALKTVVINGVEVQLPKDELGDLLAIVF
ncbi:hypothetical protein E5676_scaffold575G00220 [Cucumis melo var. makuwa]|uniref:Uncharacterized protein n=1 Tax=Cucumis melo var. makuwa TaxID=1194695 RepID=A0A5A7SPH7_CUCMM|nr:hypothetical protein E6C27_scaffold708G00510 [Cucumis melo var. makuwa]TYK30358.1 hypothetical protein E5676_scaffold575G00220 [Cucumis melo var. makuwa]